MKLVVVLLVSLCLSSCVVHFAMADPTDVVVSSICQSKCEVRCANAERNDRCKRYCGICCEQCNACVPSGTYGNESECPCYQDKLSSKGTPKCP